MYTMAIAAIALIFVAGFIAVVSVITDPPAEAGRKVAIALVLFALSLIGLLASAQRQVCISLGGEWISGNHACSGEWGGRDGART